MKQDSWNKFMETGRVSDYLEYACTREEASDKERILNSGKEGSFSDRASDKEQVINSGKEGSFFERASDKEQVLNSGKEGSFIDRTGKSNGDGTVGSPFWGL